MLESLIGRTLAGRFRVLECLAGSLGRGVYRAEASEAGPVLLSVILSPDADTTWIQHFPAETEGISPLLFAGDIEEQGTWLRVVVEAEPKGVPMTRMLSVATHPVETARILLSLLPLLRPLPPIWLAPRLIYLRDNAPSLAPRSSLLFDLERSEFKRPIWEPTLDAPEVLNGSPRTEASLVFSLCALGAWLCTGKSPFGANSIEEFRAHFYESPRSLSLPAPLQFLLAGLSRSGRPPLAELRTLLECAASGEASVFRRLFAPTRWYSAALIGPNGPEPRLSNGVLSLSQGRGAEDPILELPSPDLFTHLAEIVIETDPGTPEHRRFPLSLSPRLKRWAEAVCVERVLEGRSTAPLRLLRDFPRYQLAFRNGSQLAMAPDSQNRRLAAVFTADDSFDTFVRGKAGLEKIIMTGEELFSRLAAMPIDGIVFNCAGPAATKGVAAGFAKVVMGG